MSFSNLQDILISNSEDYQTIIWSLNGPRQQIDSYKKEPERMWVIAVHPNKNYIASGHDSGLATFSLVKERVCITDVKGTGLAFVED